MQKLLSITTTVVFLAGCGGGGGGGLATNPASAPNKPASEAQPSESSLPGSEWAVTASQVSSGSPDLVSSFFATPRGSSGARGGGEVQNSPGTQNSSATASLPQPRKEALLLPNTTLATSFGQWMSANMAIPRGGSYHYYSPYRVVKSDRTSYFDFLYRVRGTFNGKPFSGFEILNDGTDGNPVKVGLWDDSDPDVLQYETFEGDAITRDGNTFTLTGDNPVSFTLRTRLVEASPRYVEIRRHDSDDAVPIWVGQWRDDPNVDCPADAPSSRCFHYGWSAPATDAFVGATYTGGVYGRYYGEDGRPYLKDGQEVWDEGTIQLTVTNDAHLVTWSEDGRDYREIYTTEDLHKWIGYSNAMTITVSGIEGVDGIPGFDFGSFPAAIYSPDYGPTTEWHFTNDHIRRGEDEEDRYIDIEGKFVGGGAQRATGSIVNRRANLERNLILYEGFAGQFKACKEGTTGC